MAGEESSEITIVEEREELMISPLGASDETQTLRISHFIKPTLSPFSNLPNPPSSSSSSSLFSNPNLKVLFHGRPTPQRDWKTWVERLQPTHETLWRKVGIFDAIKASTFQILRQNEVVISLGERFCPETNTFVFPWGEATVTLEDISVLGGFSVVGDSVLSFSSLEHYVEHLVCKLKNVTNKIREETKLLSITHNQWLEHFMGSGDVELEHAAFLVLWLSRYVFQRKGHGFIRATLFSLAARLCSGTKIALAPAVLASIYRDLSLLKYKIMGSSQCDGDLILMAPFQLVQLWAWERFPALAPVPRNIMNHGEPRLARWGNVKKLHDYNLGMALDSARDTFRWRPYVLSVKNWSFPGSSGNAGKWVFVGCDEELETFARCLRVCQLVGLDCIEEYLPHRVGMQFGMDQDVPCSIPRLKETLEMAWSSYNRSLVGTKVYVPARLFEGDVTVRYLDWWKAAPFVHEGKAIRTYKRRVQTPTNLEGPIWSLKAKMKENQVLPVAPNPTVLKCSLSKTGNFDKDDEENRAKMLQSCDHQNGNTRKLSSPNVDDEQNPVEKLQIYDHQNGNSKAISSPNADAKENPVVMLRPCDQTNGNTSKLCNAISSATVDDEQKPAEKVQICDQQNGNSKLCVTIFSPNVDDEAKGEKNPSNGLFNENDTKKLSSCNWPVDQHYVTLSDDEEETASYCRFESLTSVLEVRISKLESMVSGLSAAKRGHGRKPIQNAEY